MATTATPDDDLRVRVVARREEAEGIAGFELVSADAVALPAFEAGAHIEVRLPFAAPGLSRPYSLCNDPAETGRYRIAVLREPASRGGSAAMHEAVREGMTLQVSRPRQQFALRPGPGRRLLLAGGIGITPLLAMARQLHREGAEFQLHLAARHRARAAFVNEIAGLPWAHRFALHLDDGPPGQRLDLDALLATRGPDDRVYVCGPAGFMAAVTDAAARHGWPADRIHQESFGAAAPQAGDGAFELVVDGTGRVIPVAADVTVLQAMRDAGLDVPSSCEQGICGTCLTTVVAGRPDHRDQYLTPEEQAAGDQFLPCCSRSCTPRLVIRL
jgi:vanillate O-demethylase ferredoxin subunit